MTILVFISVAVVILAAEVLMLIIFEQWLKARMKEERESKTSSDGSVFWKNILSYDHKKGGEKD